MASIEDHPNPSPAAPPPASGVAGSRDRPYMDWSATFAGAVAATALSLVLLIFGAGLGLSLVSPEPAEGVSMRWVAIAAGVWFVWVAVSSFGVGGYIAGRMRRPVADADADEVETRDGIHGLTVWGAGTLIAAVMAASGIGGLLGSAAAITGGAVGGVAEMIDDQADYFAGLVLRDPQTGAAPTSDMQDQIATIIVRSVIQGEMGPADREYIVQVAAATAQVPPAEVEARVDDALATVEQTRQDAIEAADVARVAGLIAAFVLTATMLVGAAVAYFGATTGGHHRDHNMPLSRFRFRRDADG